MLAGRFGSTVNFDLLYSKNQSKLVHLKFKYSHQTEEY